MGYENLFGTLPEIIAGVNDTTRFHSWVYSLLYKTRNANGSEQYKVESAQATYVMITSQTLIETSQMFGEILLDTPLNKVLERTEAELLPEKRPEKITETLTRCCKIVAQDWLVTHKSKAAQVVEELGINAPFGKHISLVTEMYSEAQEQQGLQPEPSPFIIIP